MPSGFARPLHETFFLSDAPTTDQVATWSTLLGTRSFRFQVSDPTSEELKTISRLRGADRIQIETSRFPSEDTLPVWKQLAGQGVEFVSYRAGLPREDEIQRLNEAGFAREIFVLEGVPDPEPARRLRRLKANVSLTFGVRAYPRYEDKDGLVAIPASIPLLFATDYWPWYSHMDLFNQIPNSLQLRVVGGAMPDESALPYLRNIRNLTQVAVESESDPSADDWRKLLEGRKWALTWTSVGHVPSAESMRAFLETGPTAVPSATEPPARRLIIDSDFGISPLDRDRLEKCPIPVEWIHTPPFLTRSRRNP